MKKIFEAVRKNPKKWIVTALAFPLMYWAVYWDTRSMGYSASWYIVLAICVCGSSLGVVLSIWVVDPVLRYLDDKTHKIFKT